MFTSRPPAGSRAAGQSAIDDREVHQDRAGPLDGELLDLYVAILVTVPLAFFLRSLWF